MRAGYLATALLFAASARATALTTLLLAGEKSCYYADVDGVGEKIGAYKLFEVSDGRLLLCRAVWRSIRY